MSENPLTFEQAFARLEKILEMLNNSSVSLDDSLKLYEEASRLSQVCTQKIQDAEQKIEILLKNQNGSLATDENNLPTKEPLGSYARSPLSQR